MKKLFLLTLAAGMGVNTFAQISAKKAGMIEAGTSHNVSNLFAKSFAGGKTTAVGDTFAVTNMNLATGMDTITTYYSSFDAVFDSGFVFGMNYKGDKAWAERYRVVGTDSTVSVLGVIANFNGQYNSATTMNIDFNVWSQGAKTTWLRPTLFNSGFPNAVLTSKTVSIKNLGIGVGGASVADTAKQHWFATPTAYLTTNFFVGYSANYTWGTALNGDTIGLKSNLDGERHTVGYTVSGTDTTVNNQNATMYADGTWHDNLQENFGMFNHLYIFPIIKIGAAVNNSVTGVNRNNLTFYGNYPNPASTSTNVRFALAKGTDVTIAVMDVNGKVVNTVNNANLSAGEHTISLETSNLAVGQYIYVIRTAEGDGMASPLTIVK